ncbi:hypothetical protein EUGRSUZ_F02853 [Eucalyptus grandis]|uniref:Uncharacterized protein n=2 Tax=Eucalyptus grandis TaxID=71139 RepID=A0ACC3KJC7_EUCGR|nr:hypothetical protein EUGRSUZ_F02853 [Eucalyptus grandis]
MRPRRRSPKRRNPESHARPQASQQAAERPPRMAGQRGSSRKKRTDDSLNQCPESTSQREPEEKGNDEPGGESGHADSDWEVEVNERGCSPSFSREDMDGSDWEDGSAQVMESRESCVNGVTIEFSHSPDLIRRKLPCRASAEEKVVKAGCVSAQILPGISFVDVLLFKYVSSIAMKRSLQSKKSVNNPSHRISLTAVMLYLTPLYFADIRD